jgi:hypothetical protein
LSYCSVGDVRSIVDTDITDAEITTIIGWVDSIIDVKADVGTLSATYLENLSATYAAYRCMLKDPNARSLGEYSERRDAALTALKAEVDYLMTSGGASVGILSRMEAVN